MSEAIQRRARDLRDRALDRARKAATRAVREHALGDRFMAGFHERSADAQRMAADAADRARTVDVAIEGDRLNDAG